jgi:hypothetical protein
VAGPTTSPSLTDTLAQRAIGLPAGEGSEDELIALAGTDRAALEAARNRMAARLHGRADDYQATAALTLLNRALARYGWYEKYNWKVRYAKHRKP